MAAPLLCAGITVFSPMIRHKMNQPGKSLGVIGLGKLSACRLQSSAPASPRKRKLSLDLLGADRFVISSNKQEMESLAKSLDFIVDTASFRSLHVAPQGSWAPGPCRTPRRSAIESSKPSSWCQNHIWECRRGHQRHTRNAKLLCIEVIKIQDINEALDRIVNKDVKYRFVIDIANSLN
ncbi:hypothetical protein OPV22_003848 [Ensete ventricosum]|uniref:Alcohol dehydrogenase-like C-terminal domain-containing protein n=1 Tax=Ensete ventricosum TaxID=4639 RepID=A0AAV8S251_ENSVE|nr:hypothetical protein OPV22_003848 [Ensete ventricosum]